MPQFIKPILSILIIAVTLFTACELVVPVELPEQEPKLTINSLVGADSLIRVRASMSKTMLDPDNSGDYPSIGDATVELFVNGTKEETLVYNVVTERYEGQSQAIPGKSYTLKASRSNLDPVEVTTNVPFKVAVISSSATRNAKTVDGENRARFRFTFPDEAEVENYYRFIITLEDPNGFEYPLCYYSRDPSLVDLDILGETGEIEICEPINFSDELFDGKDKEVTLYIPEVIISQVPGIKINVHLVHLSRDMYLYEQSSRTQQNTQGNPFAEPVFVYNNVVNGYGIFGGYNVSKHNIAF